MRGFRLSLPAEHDLEEIQVYIAQDNPVAADGVINKIESACQLIAEHPGVGRHRDEIETDVMSFPSGSYLIFYVVEEDGVVGVARIIYGSRDVEAAFHE